MLANEERENGIRVSNVYPGEIDTPILAARPTPVTDEQRAVILKPEDVAAAVLFVAAPAAARVGAGTGHQADGANVLLAACGRAGVSR